MSNTIPLLKWTSNIFEKLTPQSTYCKGNSVAFAHNVYNVTFINFQFAMRSRLFTCERVCRCEFALEWTFNWHYMSMWTRHQLDCGASQKEGVGDQRYVFPRRVLRTRQGTFTLHEHLIPLLFCTGVRWFQAFVRFVYVLSFGLFQICLVSLDYAILIPHMSILHWTPVEIFKHQKSIKW